jgi:N,N-dimethylformamidase beta subunit-like, C-terminal/Concanavalin A-like lectin/glucanases superfamily
MNDQTRREFFAATATVLAATGSGPGPAGSVEDQRFGAGRDPAGHGLFPPHRPLLVEGIHAYTSQVSVAAGESIRVHVSSSCPYELTICRLGSDPNSTLHDETVHSFGQSVPNVQPIHVGSYLHVENRLDPKIELTGLTLEIWVRRWRTLGRQALLSQLDDRGPGGFGLFVGEDGSIGFYTGGGDGFHPENLHTTGPGQIKMQINPLGLKIQPDNTPSSVLQNQWHHVVACADRESKRVWIDGVNVATWKTPGPIRPGDAPLRIGASGKDGLADSLLDADIAMPAIYAKALSADEIATRFRSQALSRPAEPALLGCWPLDEERGDRAADASPHRRDARIINQGTWMIGGPSFRSDVPRAAAYDPSKDPTRGHGLRLASDDLFDCRWQVSHECRLSEQARSGIYAARIRFSHDGEERLYHSVFIVKKAASRPKAPIAFLCSTNTWRAYAATPFCSSWSGLKKSIGNNGFTNSPGDPPAFCLYRPHRAGQGTHFTGSRMPWPVVGPYTLMGPPEWDYSHLCRQDRFTQTWLEASGYSYDVLSDTDLHMDGGVLDGYNVLFVVGHSEYWSFDAMNAVSRFLDRGGNAVVLSGNTAFWRVTFNSDATLMECRKGDAPGTQVRSDRRGEMWHSHDGGRGGMSRECGFPAWRLFGLEYFSLVGVGSTGVGPYLVRNANHFLFREPVDLHLRDGDRLGLAPGQQLPQPIGHEGDVRVSTLARFQVEPPPEGMAQPVSDPPGITLLAQGFADWKNVAIGAPWDYFQRSVPAAKAPAIPVAAEMIYWQRPGGGRVFHSGSINSGMTLEADPKWSGLLKNVLSHFGVPRP